MDLRRYQLFALFLYLIPFSNGYKSHVPFYVQTKGRGSSHLCDYYMDLRKALNVSKRFTSTEYKMSCRNQKCESKDSRHDTSLNCYCDSLCLHFNDCCLDYSIVCRAKKVQTNLTCRFIQGEMKTGYMMIDNCPASWKNENIKRKCKEDSSEMLTIFPVTDVIKYTIYKNIFCAICNKVRYLKYWNIEVRTSEAIGKNMTVKEFLIQEKNWKFVNHENYTKYESYCKPQYPGCKNESSLANLLHMSSTQLQTICNSYSFSLKVCSRPLQKRILRNLHCMMCEGNLYTEKEFKGINERCGAEIQYHQTITFDFVAHDYSSYRNHDNQPTRIITYRCREQSIYDPFSDKCRKINEKNYTKIPSRHKEKMHNFKHNNLSCTVLFSNNSQNVSVLSNGSVTINGRIRHDIIFVVIDNSSFICWNDTLSTTFLSVSTNQQNKTVLEVITAVGFTLSSAFLVFLLFTYTIFADLRTTPGKCVMSLSCAVLLYMACHVPLMSTSYPVLCTGNAIVLHFSLLAVFSWLSALAFDIAKCFGSQASTEKVVVRYQAAARKRRDPLFLKYCAYSWGIPLAIVSVCALLDFTDTFKFRYGHGRYCYISTSLGIISAVIAPIAVILLFNAIALVKTILGIKKMKKDASLASQCSPIYFASLYLKLTCLFGLTWILNILFAFTQAAFLEYLAVVINSCQGIFICLGFCFNKRVLNFYKTKLGITQASKPSQTS